MSLAQVDLSPAQYRLLVLLADRPDVASKLADQLAVSRPSITAVVDGLVARGLVERRNCSDDRRRVEHSLTPAGRRLLKSADDQVDARLAEVASHLDSEAEITAAIEALDRWRLALNRFWLEKRGAKSGSDESVVEAKA